MAGRASRDASPPFRDALCTEASRRDRNLPVYELRRAHEDGALGPNLSPFEGECKDFRIGTGGTLEASTTAPGIRCSFGVSQNRVDAVGSDWADLNLAA